MKEKKEKNIIYKCGCSYIKTGTEVSKCRWSHCAKHVVELNNAKRELSNVWNSIMKQDNIKQPSPPL